MAEQPRGKVSDKTICQFRVLMYGTGYGLAAFGALFLADTLLRIWRAFQQ